MLRLAVERAFAIIGEALSQLTKLDAAVATRIGEHHRIIAFRNILIHAYAEVDNRPAPALELQLSRVVLSC